LTDEKRLKEAVFYLDESIYSRVLASAMEDLGANVRRVGAWNCFGSRPPKGTRLVVRI
jgi:hypothetical protein